MGEPALVRSPVLLAEQPWLTALPAARRVILRGAEEVRAAAARALDLALPTQPCRAATAGERAALWLGPDEWLLLATPPDVQLDSALAAGLGSLDHSRVEVSHRQVGLQLAGAQASVLLASGCPLDLDLGAFPAGMCTRTILGKAEVVLWRTGPEVFRLEVWRSFVAYVADYLAEAARGSI
ncbi:MAG: sarcosine oxidase subunit gamma [Gammaproteobacteria bacterium]|nr:sarcosine oxidase subunit gamma [Gammaproteobacteria bacterium]MBV9621635.1 sarcosine oxidase subunit gamma [Gammaproteobacteria bacterium]